MPLYHYYRSEMKWFSSLSLGLVYLDIFSIDFHDWYLTQSCGSCYAGSKHEAHEKVVYKCANM